jgi:hypothetical protein
MTDALRELSSEEKLWLSGSLRIFVLQLRSVGEADLARKLQTDQINISNMVYHSDRQLLGRYAHELDENDIVQFNAVAQAIRNQPKSE